MSTLHRELCGIVSALQTYEQYIIGSPSRSVSTVITNPYSISGEEKDSYLINFSTYRVIITKFHNLKIIWTPGSNLVFPDIFSRNVMLSEANKIQPQHKKIHMIYHSMFRTVTRYTILSSTKTNKNATCNHFYPIICQQGITKKTLRLKNDENEHHVGDYLEDNEILATMQDMTDCFKLGKTNN